MDKLNLSVFNRIYLNSSALSFLNTSAELTIRGLSFTNAMPYADFGDSGTFGICTNPQCNVTSYLGGVLIFNVSKFTAYRTQESSVCGTLSTPSSTTTLLNNVSSAGTCFTITANSVTLDCQGYTINASGGAGVSYRGYDYATIKNCNIIAGTRGVQGEVSRSNNALIVNNTITSGDHAVIITGSNSIVANNTLNSSGVGVYVANYASPTDNNLVFNNNITANTGITFYSNPANNNLTSNRIALIPSGTYYIAQNSGAGSGNTITNTTFYASNNSIRYAQQLAIPSDVSVGNSDLNVTAFNRIYLNSASLSWLNTSAELTIRNIVFGSARPAVDYADSGTFSECGSPQCNITSYLGGTLIFRAGRFTAYKAEEGAPSAIPVSSCQELSSANSNYYLIQNISSSGGTCFNVTANNVTFDCTIFSITGSQKGYGINSTNYNGTVVKSCLIQNFTSGVFLSNSHNGTIYNNTIVNSNGTKGTNGAASPQSGGTGGVGAGIYLTGSNGTNISGNTFANITGGKGGTGAGTGAAGSGGAGGIGAGIYLANSARNILSSNIMSNILGGPGGDGSSGGVGSGGVVQQGYGIFIDSTSLNNNINESNTLDANPIFYAYNKTGISIQNLNLTAASNPTSLGKIVMINSSGVIYNNTISNYMGVGGASGTAYQVPGSPGSNGSGILILNSSGVNISFNNLTNIFGGTGGTGGYAALGGVGGFGIGISLQNSSAINLSSNTLTNVSGGVGGKGGGYWTGGDGGPGMGVSLLNSSIANLTSSVLGIIGGGAGGAPGSYGSSSGLRGSGSYIYTDGNSAIGNVKGGITFSEINNTIRYPQTLTFTVPASTNISTTLLNISAFNRIYLNSSALSFLNTSAELTIRGLVFLAPYIIVDFEDDGSFVTCASPQCNITSYSGGTLVFSVPSFTTYSGQGILNCTTPLNQSNIVATLTEDVNSSGTCFSIGANNITLDCAGHTINYSQSSTGYGINITGYNSTTIKNCKIIQGSSNTDSYGIFIFNGSNSNNITNSTITTSSDYSYGLFLRKNASNNSISNSTITTSGRSSHSALFYDNSNNTRLIGNRLTTTGLNSHGIFFNTSSLSNIVNNTINVTGSSSIDLLLLQNSNSNNLTGNILLTNVSNGSYIVINSSPGNNLTNSTFAAVNNSVRYPQILSLPSDYDVSVTKLNISSFNLIYLNSSVLSFLNTSAELTIKGLSFTNAMPFVDFADNGTFNMCKAPQCNITNYSGGTLIFNVSRFTVYRAQESSACGTLGSSTTLLNDVNSSGTCFTINSNDIILDCNGFTINYSQSATGNGVYVNDGLNIHPVTIKNCSIVQGNSSIPDSHGIYLGGWDGTITNNNITTSGSGSYAIRLRGGRSALSNNILTSNDSAIYLPNGDNRENIFNNILITTGSFATIAVGPDVWQNTLSSNIVINSNPAGSYFTTPSSFGYSDNSMTNMTFYSANNSVRYRQAITLIANMNISTIGLNLSAFNRVYLNSSALSYLNKSAELTIRNLQFESARPLVAYDDANFSVCSSPQCNITSYAGGALTFNVSSFTTYSSEDSPVQCGATFNTSNSVHLLSQNVSSNGTCFNVQANNVTIDCNGYTINYAQSTVGYGVNVSGYNLTTIKNCNIAQGVTSNNAYGVFINSSNSSSILNNNITAKADNAFNSPGCVPIYLTNSTGTNISNNNLNATTSAAPVYGIYALNSSYSNVSHNSVNLSGDNSNYNYFIMFISSSSNNIISDNVITTTGLQNSNPRGIILGSGSANNLVADNNITTSNRSCCGPGIRIFGTGSDNNTISGNFLNITGSSTSGIVVTDSKNNTVINNRVITPGGAGITLYQYTVGNNVSGNRLDSNGVGILVGSGTDSSNNTITSNNITSNSTGISLNIGINNTVYNNTVLTSAASVSAISVSTANNNITGNMLTANGNNSNVLVIGANNNSVSSNIILTTGANSSGIYVSGSNNTVSNNTANSTNYAGIYLSGAANNTITNNTASLNVYGVLLNSSSRNNTISNNTLFSNSQYGIFLQSSSGNSIFGNIETANGAMGIYLANATNNTISGDAVTNSSMGIVLNSSSNNNTISASVQTNGSYGLYVSNSSYNMILYSNFSFDTLAGVYLYSASNNTMLGLTITDSTYGIYFNASSGNNVTNTTSNATTGYFFTNDSSSNTGSGNTGTVIDQGSGNSVMGLNCGAALDTPDTVYNMTQNVSAPGTCFTIGANNVTLDCQGYIINYSQSEGGSGINVSGYDYATIRNCNIMQTAELAGASAIRFDSINYGNIINNNITTRAGTNSVAVLFEGSNSNNGIANNSILSQWSGGSGRHGILLQSSGSNNSISNNTITLPPASNSYGIDLNGPTGTRVSGNTISTYSTGVMIWSSGSNISNNVVTVYGPGYLGMQIWAGDNILSNNSITTTGSSGLGIRMEAGNNSISDNTITTSGSLGDGIRVDRGNGVGNYNRFSGNVISTSGLDAAGIRLFSDGNNVTSNNLSAAGASCIYISGIAASNLLANNTLTYSNPSSAYLVTDGSVGTGSNSNNLTGTIFNANNNSIRFLQVIAITPNANVSAARLNLTGFNRVHLNSSALQFLNTTAEVTLRGLGFADPFPAVDFEDDGTFIACESPQCNVTDYVGGIFRFTVASFTTYSSQEGDTMPPVTNISLNGTTGTGGWYIGDVAVTLNATDDFRGVNTTYYCVDQSGICTPATAYTVPFLVTIESSNDFVRYYSMDNAGNNETVKTQQMKIDKSPSSTNISLAGTAGNNSWYTSNVNVTLGASDSISGVNATLYSTDGFASVNLTYSGQFTISAEGTTNVSYYSVDNAGNTETIKSQVVKVDKSLPSSNISLSGTLGSNGWYVSNVNVVLNASDSVSGINTIRYSTDAFASTNYTYSGSFVVSNEGTTTIHYYTVDNAGLTDSIKSQVINIDKTAPTTPTLNDPGLYDNNGVVTLTWSVSNDSTSGLDKYKVYRCPTTTPADCSVSLFNESNTTGYTDSGLADGTRYLYKVSAVDLAGLEGSQSNMADIIEDFTPPSSSVLDAISSNGFLNILSVPLTWSASVDPGVLASGLNKYLLFKNSLQFANTTSQGYNDTAVSENSTYYYNLTAKDNANNLGNRSNTQSVTLDLTPPASVAEVISGLVGNNSWYRTDATVRINSSDSVSGVQKREYSLGAGFAEYTAPFDVTTEGTNTITYRAIDNANNTESNKTLVVKVDKTLPSTNISLAGTAGNNSWYTSNVNVTLSASDTVSGINAIRYSTDGFASVNLTYSATFTVSSEGINTISYYSVDNAGNPEIIKNATIKIDKSLPSSNISLIGTLGGAGWYVSNVNVVLNASDSVSGINAIRYSTDAFASTNYTYTGSFVVSNEGTTTITYYSVDNSGRSGAVNNMTMDIDKSMPFTNITLSGTLGDNGWYISDVTVTLNATGNISGVNQSYYCIDQADNCAPTTAYAGPFAVSTESSSDYVRYYSVSNAGNNETISSLMMKIDKTTPTAVKLYDPGSIIDTNTTTVKWANSTDAISGLDRYKLYRCDVEVQTNSSTNCTPATVIAEPTSAQYTDDNLTFGRRYFYQVSAVDAAGLEGGLSNTVDLFVASANAIQTVQSAYPTGAIPLDGIAPNVTNFTVLNNKLVAEIVDPRDNLTVGSFYFGSYALTSVSTLANTTEYLFMPFANASLDAELDIETSDTTGVNISIALADASANTSAGLITNVTSVYYNDSHSGRTRVNFTDQLGQLLPSCRRNESASDFCVVALIAGKSDSVTELNVSNVSINMQYASGIRIPEEAPNATKFSLRSGITFADNSTVAALDLTAPDNTSYATLRLPKYAFMRSVYFTLSPSNLSGELIIDMLNDSAVDWNSSMPTTSNSINPAIVRIANLSSYLGTCVPVDSNEEGPLCDVPVRFASNISAQYNITVVYSFINVPTLQTGTELIIERGSSLFVDYFEYPVNFTNGTSEGNFTHKRTNAFHTPQENDRVSVRTLDRNWNWFTSSVMTLGPVCDNNLCETGERGSCPSDCPVAQPPPPPKPPAPLISLSGSLECARETGMITTVPGAYIEVIFAQTSLFVAGGTANSAGVFEFLAPLPGRYSVSASKVDFLPGSIELNARNCVVPLTLGVVKKMVCEDRACRTILDVTSSRQSDIELDLSQYIPTRGLSNMRVVDRLAQPLSTAFDYLDHTFKVPATSFISNQFSLVFDTLVSITRPVFDATTGKAIIAITNPSDEYTTDTLTLPLPEGTTNKSIQNITYVPSGGGSPILITDYTIENNTLVIRQPITIKQT